MTARNAGQQPYLRLVKPPSQPDVRWASETDANGRRVELLIVPRDPLFLHALRGFRADLRLRGMSGDNLTFEVLDGVPA